MSKAESTFTFFSAAEHFNPIASALVFQSIWRLVQQSIEVRAVSLLRMLVETLGLSCLLNPKEDR